VTHRLPDSDDEDRIADGRRKGHQRKTSRTSIRTQCLLAFRSAVVLASLASGTAACDRSEAIRADLKVREVTWSRELSVLRDRQADDAGHLASLTAPAAPGNRAQVAAWTQLKATILGRRQSLTDLQLVLSAGVTDVEDRLAQGEQPGAEALETLSAQMNDGLKTQEQQLAVTSNEWLRLSSGAPAAGAGTNASQ
jgi:hypothetical protein